MDESKKLPNSINSSKKEQKNDNCVLGKLKNTNKNELQKEEENVCVEQINKIQLQGIEPNNNLEKRENTNKNNIKKRSLYPNDDNIIEHNNTQNKKSNNNSNLNTIFADKMNEEHHNIIQEINGKLISAKQYNSILNDKNQDLLLKCNQLESKIEVIKNNSKRIIKEKISELKDLLISNDSLKRENNQLREELNILKTGKIRVETCGEVLRCFLCKSSNFETDMKVCRHCDRDVCVGCNLSGHSKKCFLENKVIEYDEEEENEETCSEESLNHAIHGYKDSIKRIRNEYVEDDDYDDDFYDEEYLEEEEEEEEEEYDDYDGKEKNYYNKKNNNNKNREMGAKKNDNMSKNCETLNLLSQEEKFGENDNENEKINSSNKSKKFLEQVFKKDVFGEEINVEMESTESENGVNKADESNKSQKNTNQNNKKIQEELNSTKKYQQNKSNMNPKKKHQNEETNKIILFGNVKNGNETQEKNKKIRVDVTSEEDTNHDDNEKSKKKALDQQNLKKINANKDVEKN